MTQVNRNKTKQDAEVDHPFFIPINLCHGLKLNHSTIVLALEIKRNI